MNHEVVVVDEKRKVADVALVFRIRGVKRGAVVVDSKIVAKPAAKKGEGA